LAITGLVEKPIAVTYPELLALPRIRAVVTLECVGNGVAGDAISTAEWEGVSLKLLLEEARVTSTAYDLVFKAADGYSDSIPVERALAGDVLVAYRMNGVPLPQGHGFPARIIVPGLYGMKHVQWLTEIALVDHDYQGYYQRKGWSDEAVVKTTSRVDLPEHGSTLRGPTYTVQGLAFAGTRGIKQVELSMDEGKTWHQVVLDPEISPSAWRFWSYRWTLPAQGRYTLLVRATDGTGRPQAAVDEGPAPDGATGLHEITVTVRA
jgi:DMSO/TMAO reductase YedYZ molybdopterin-dependent catalytic subunit